VTHADARGGSIHGGDVTHADAGGGSKHGVRVEIRIIGASIPSLGQGERTRRLYSAFV
jgi:hypothetical protein